MKMNFREKHTTVTTDASAAMRPPCKIAACGRFIPWNHQSSAAMYARTDHVRRERQPAALRPTAPTGGEKARHDIVAGSQPLLHLPRGQRRCAISFLQSSTGAAYKL